MAAEKLFVHLDFIYAGQRVDGKGNVFVSIIPIRKDGSLAEPMLFDKKSIPQVRNIGGIYHGAEFDSELNTIRGAKSATYAGLWESRDDRITWDAQHREALEILARRKLEKEDSGSEIERIMLPLREHYMKAVSRYDGAACAALERAVLQALRTPLRVKERR